VLGSVSTAVARKRSERRKHCDVPLPESIKQLGVTARNDLLPSAINRVSCLVVDHSDVVITRSVVACCFGVSPPIVVEVDDPILANETACDDLERDIASQVASYAQNDDQHAQQLIKALGACHYRIETSGGGEQSRVPTLPASSPIAAPVVLDPARDQSAIRRFGALFATSGSSPRAKARSKATLLRGQLSSCEVLVHFDEERRAHVVLLVGPTREILSRCAHVRRNTESELAPLETNELHGLQDIVVDMEVQGQTVVSFAELTLDPEKYPVGIKFDLMSDNLPTSGLCYLGSLALAEKLHPEVVLMGAFARSAGVRLLVAASKCEFPQFGVARDHISNISSALDDDTEDDEEEEDETETTDVSGALKRRRVRAICEVPVELREAATGRAEIIDTRVFPSSVLSVSNTLRQWQRVVQDRSIVVFDGCGSEQIDLLVETLQELGECVALAASGSANAIAVSNADVGFAVPASDIVDLCESAADVVLGSATCPRSDAIRLIEAVKKLPHLGSDALGAPEPLVSITSHGSGSRGKATMINLMREALNVGRMLGIDDRELHQCFEHAFQGR
jgi:CheY-like chemotaxis protein